MTLFRNGVECSWVVPRWAVDVTEVIYYQARSQEFQREKPEFYLGTFLGKYTAQTTYHSPQTRVHSPEPNYTYHTSDSSGGSG